MRLGLPGHNQCSLEPPQPNLGIQEGLFSNRAGTGILRTGNPPSRIARAITADSSSRDATILISAFTALFEV